MLGQHIFNDVAFQLDDWHSLDVSLVAGYFNEVEVLKEHCCNGVFIDVGANAGYFSIPLSRYARRVIAIEPDYLALVKLRNNINANRNIDNIDIVCAAASNDSRLVYFFASSFNPGNNSTNETNVISPEIRGFIHTFKIDSLKLDYVDLIKVDVEGEEFNALLGALDTIKRCRPVIYWEQNLILENNTVEQTKELLSDLGYEHSYPVDCKTLCNVLSTPA